MMFCIRDDLSHNVFIRSIALELSMKYFLNSLILLLCMILGSALHAREDIKLLTPNTPPFVFKVADGPIEGVFYDRVECALNKLGLTYSVSLEPWKRAQAEVQVGRADGFFPASRSDFRDTYASLSDSVMEAEFYFYYLKNSMFKPKDPDFNEMATVSAFWGSMRYQELQEAGFQLGPEAHTFETLFDLADHGRVDAVLLSGVMGQSILERRGRLENYERSFHSSRPMGVYFANVFLEQHPGFLNNFNHRIKGCSIKKSLDH